MLHFYSLAPMALLRAYTSRFAYTRFMFLVFAFFSFVGTGFGQTVNVFPQETFGDPSSNTNVNTYTGYTNNSTLTFSRSDCSNTATDIRKSNPVSNGYLGASGNGFVLLNANSKCITISGINTTDYTELVLQFGIRKATNASTQPVIVEVSSDGINYTNLTYTNLPNNQTGWYLRTASGAIPSTSNLRIKFTGNEGTNTAAVDDIILTGKLTSTINVTYDDNGATGGTVPEDATDYEEDDEVTVLGNTGGLTRTGYIFAGWNTSADGSGTDYEEADTFEITEDVTLYAQWTAVTDAVDWCNLQWPRNGTIELGEAFDVYGQVYEPGITPGAGQGAGITAEIGYSTTNTNPNTWTNWINATYNPACIDCNGDQNDEYFANLGAAITATGTYYYAIRYTLNSGQYRYGGILDDGSAGDFWDGITYLSGVLVVENAPTCNGSESFDNAILTATYANGSFVGDTGLTWTYGHSRDEENTPINGNGIMLRRASDSYLETTITGGLGTFSFDYRKAFTGNEPRQLELLVDGNQVAITPIFGDFPTGADATVHNFSYDVNTSADVTIRIKNVGATTTNRQTIIDNIVFTCYVPSPELQLVDADGVNQNCGFTLGYGSIGIGNNSELTFTIENVGVLDLDVTSLVLSGANTGDYTIVSPIGGFTVNPGDSQDVVVRFTPTANGTRTATLTINNNDANEGACTVLLTGVGYTPAPNIRVEKNTFAIIDNGAFATTGNNTVFAITNVGSTSSPKTYYIRNGNTSSPATADLTVNSLVSSNNAEFSISLVNVPSLPVTLSPEEFIEFEITFSPNSTTPVTRTGVITVTSTDSSNNPYTFHVEGTAGCPLYSGTIYPTSGPIGTEITITSAQNLTGASATLNGVPLTTVSSTAGELIVKLPETITLGGVLTVQLNNGCSFTNTFTLVDKSIQSCEGSGATPSNLFISQITDSPRGSLTYIELYNGTGAAINFATTNYQLRVYNNGNTINFQPINLNSGIIANNGTYVVAVGTNDVQCTVAGGNGSLAQQSVLGSSINFHYDGNLNEGHDFIGLYNNSATLIDAFGVFGDETWAIGLNLGSSGANFSRNPTATLPSATFAVGDWDIVDWDGCAVADYSDIGTFDYSVGVPPTVSTLLAPEVECGLSATLTVTGTEGFAGSNPLTYQWYYNEPGQTGWVAITNGSDYSGATTNTLTIANTLGFNGYQYYCQVREDDALCYTASNAVKLALAVKTWVGTTNEWYEAANWSPVGVPTANDIVIITSSGQSPLLAGGGIPLPPMVAYAKSMVVENGATLTLPTDQNLIVEECLINYGTIDLKNSANLVQVNENDQNSGNGNFFMERVVSDVENLNYIYWSAPIGGFDIAGIPGSNIHRYYWSPTVTNANGSDGDWIQTTGNMARGVGYIIRTTGATPALNVTLGGNGLGTPFNGTFTTPIAKGDYVYPNPADDNNNYWNLVGNPYPSAISADTFISVNAGQLMDDDPNPAVIGTIYLWRHQSTPDDSFDNPFYEDFQINYDGNNYVSYNATGSNPANEFDGNIASGQAFFVVIDEATALNTVSFTNAMRYSTSGSIRSAHDNHPFLRVATEQQESQSTATMERHRIWLDLIAPNNTSTSTLIGYVTGATNDKDRLFDGYETNATGLGFYSLVSYERMGIQGRALPFVDSDMVPLGVNLIQTGTHTIAINQVDGLFADGQHIYLEDTYTNTIHNMRATPYTFHSVGGRFNDRFILRYTNSTLSIPDANLDAGLTIIELPNGHVKFSVGHNLTIQSVELFDMLGRQLYHLQGSQATEVYNVSNLSQAAYVAKVTLSNGQTVTKRAVKRK